MLPSSSEPFQKLRSEPSLPPTMLEIGDLPREEFSNFKSHVEALVSFITTKDQDKKHGWHVKAGGFIQAVCRASIDSITSSKLQDFPTVDLNVNNKENSYLLALVELVKKYTCGELTDVGNHTHHEKRDVAWYLSLGSLYSVLTLPSSSEGFSSEGGYHVKENTLSPEFAQLITCVVEVYVMIALADRKVEEEFLGEVTFSFQAKFETCSQMVESAGRRARVIVEDPGLEPSLLAVKDVFRKSIVPSLEYLRARLDAASQELNFVTCKRWTLTPSHLTEGDFPSMNLSLDPLPEPAFDSGAATLSLSELEKLANENLSSAPMLANIQNDTSYVKDTVAALSSWLTKHSSYFINQCAYRHLISTVEGVLFTAALGLPAGGGKFTHDPLDLGEVKALNEILVFYFKAVKYIMNECDKSFEMVSTLRSRELLASWISTALGFCAADAKHPLLGNRYKLPLNREDLWHLKLDDSVSRNALLALAAHLQSKEGNFPIFSLRAREKQFLLSFADEVGTCARCDSRGMISAEFSATLRTTYTQEVAEANKREDDHWRIVLGKREEVQQLENKLEREKALRDEKYKEYLNAERKREKRLKQEYNSLCSTVRSTRSLIEHERKCPSPVFQPLPRDERIAFQVLFFLYLDPLLRSLGEMIFTSQSLLFQDRPGETREMKTKWDEYYNYHSKRSISWPSFGPGLLHCGSIHSVPAHVGGFYIKDLRRPSDGIYHPDSIIPEVFWKPNRSSQNMSDPFFVSQFSVQYFTESLAKAEDTLSWALPISHAKADDINKERGNEPIAKLHKKPQHMSCTQFLAFGGLRATPAMQLRRITEVLESKSLQFSRPETRVLLLSALYQVGPTTNPSFFSSSSPSAKPTKKLKAKDLPAVFGPSVLEWHQDLQLTDIISRFASLLMALAEDVKETPCEWASLAVLVPLAVHMSEYSHLENDIGGLSNTLTIKDPVRAFGEVARSWGDAAAQDLEISIQGGAEPDKERELHTRACMFYSYAVLAFAGPATYLTDHDYKFALECRLLSHSFLPFTISKGSNAVPFEKEAFTLYRLGSTVLSRRSSELIAYLLTPGGSVTPEGSVTLNSALQNVMPSAPLNLDFKQSGQTLSFNAVFQQPSTSQTTLYSVNCFSGLCLLDGFPTSRLPSSILENKFYKRHFSDKTKTVRNFEVMRSGNVFETRKPCDGCYYTFCLSRHGGLKVEEREEKTSKKWELLDTGDQGSVPSWVKILPHRLRLLFSLWLLREQGLVVFRNPFFLERRVYWIFEINSSSFYRVSEDLPSMEWEEVWERRKEFQQLVVPVEGGREGGDCGPSPLKVLSKFEPADFCHLLRSPPCEGSRLRVYFPRLLLEFELRDDGRLHSVDVNGYFLAEKQVIEGTLFGFNRYLVLENSTGVAPNLRFKILVPFIGAIAKHKDADEVVIETFDDSLLDSGSLKFHTFDVHPRLNWLTAPSSTESRLFLASLHAATSLSLPDSRLQMTGVERACMLLRSSWTNSPLSEASYETLSSLRGSLGARCSSLRILATELAASAASLSPMHLSPGGQMLSKTQDLPRDAPEVKTSYVHARTQGGGGTGRVGMSPLSPRLLLSSTEEKLAMGKNLPPFSYSRLLWKSGSNISGGGGRTPMVTQVILGEECLLKAQKRVAELGSFSKRREAAAPPFPLSTSDKRSLAEIHIITTLEDSWRDLHNLDRSGEFINQNLGLDDITRISKELGNMKHRITRSRNSMEERLMEILTNLPEDCDGPDASVISSFQILRAVGVVPIPSLADLVTLAVPTEGSLVLDYLNPFLPADEISIMPRACLLWMRWCVLENCITRATLLCSAIKEGLHTGESPSSAALIQELKNAYPSFEASEHPSWVAFELENSLSIRSIQAKIALHLLKSPGTMIQLNMGEGKTRVILPLLILAAWEKRGRRREEGLLPSVTRVYILNQLLGEAEEYYRTTLTASLLRVRIFRTPFSRDVKIMPGLLSQLESTLALCSSTGGAVCLAPEHSLSALLQSVEANNPYLRSIITRPSFDIYDECDFALSHKINLIYAVGERIDLPGGHLRWAAISKICELLASPGGVGEQIRAKEWAICDNNENNRPGGFNSLRLIAVDSMASKVGDSSSFSSSSSSSSSSYHCLFVEFADELMKSPPCEGAWLVDLDLNSAKRNAVLRFIVDPSFDETELDTDEVKLGVDLREFLYTLRGLFAHGILAHSFSKRHRVEYGIDRTGKDESRTRLAVPYTSADTPSLRSEFSHLDKCLVLTHLAYFDDGLNDDEVRSSFVALLTLGKAAQENLYASWFELYNDWYNKTRSRNENGDSGLTEEEEEYPFPSSLDLLSKIDLSSGSSLKALSHAYRFNRRLISFYLSAIVFPEDTRTFPKRLTATPWHLTGSLEKGEKMGSASLQKKFSVGFSGTRDLGFVLPLNVKMDMSTLPSLTGTDGKMLGCMARSDDYIPLQIELNLGDNNTSSANNLPPLAKAVLQCALDKNASAIIDAGALLAGISGKDVGNFLLPLLPSEFRGFVYFNLECERPDWWLATRKRQSWPLKGSPIREADAFVFFDQHRSRGSDMKLKADAIGLITLGSGLCRDALMQAAGRMRGIHDQQSVILCGPPEVTSKMLASSDNTKVKESRISALKCVEFVLHNTREQMEVAIGQWASHGAAFATTELDDRTFCMEEVNELKTLYAGVSTRMLLPKFADSLFERKEQHLRKLKVSFGGTNTLSIREEVVDRVRDYGGDVLAPSVNQLEEECEREFEREPERQKEQEVEVPKVEAMPESMWLHGSRAHDFVKGVDVDSKLVEAKIMKVKDFVTTKLRAPKPKPLPIGGLGKLRWDENLFMTQNYWNTIKIGGEEVLNQYQRGVGSAIIVTSDSNKRKIILLAPFESEYLLRAYHDAMMVEREGKEEKGKEGERGESKEEEKGKGKEKEGEGEGGDFHSTCTLGEGNRPSAPVFFEVCPARRVLEKLNEPSALKSVSFPLTLPVGMDGKSVLSAFSPKMAASLILFEGGTQFRSKLLKEELNNLVSGVGPVVKGQARCFADMRGEGRQVYMSDLEKACRRRVDE